LALVERVSREPSGTGTFSNTKTTPSRHFFEFQSLLIASAMMCHEQAGALDMMDMACGRLVDVEIDLAFQCQVCSRTIYIYLQYADQKSN
jgi:hypothetical protein